jgi:hypothetical protein
MKARLFFITLLSVLFVSGYAHAQDYAFKVLASKGKNSVQNGAALKIGSTIKTGVILMEEDGYLGLRHNNGKTIELRKKGTYKVEELAQTLSGKSEGLASKYLAYVADELTKEDVNIDENRHKHMSKTGAVDRSTCAMSPVNLLLPRTVKIFGDKAAISWAVDLQNDAVKGKDSKPEVFRLIVKDLFGNVLLEKDVEGYSYVIDFGSDKFKGQTDLLYSVAVKNLEDLLSCEQSIHRISSKDSEKISFELASIGEDNTAITKVVQAQYFEEKKLYSNAIHAYLEAMKLAPEVKSYKRMYQTFLEKIPAEVDGK